MDPLSAMNGLDAATTPQDGDVGTANSDIRMRGLRGSAENRYFFLFDRKSFA